jgi:transmembrane sensor
MYLSSIQIEQIAAHWLARRDDGNWSAADEVELRNWLEESTAHRIAYIRLEAAWRAAARLKGYGSVELSGNAYLSACMRGEDLGR